MKISLIDSAFPMSKQKNIGIATRCIKWQLLRHGIEITKNINNSDYIFLSSTHPIESIYAKKLKKYNKKIVLGGAGALSPYAYLDHVDYVVLGDGDNIFKNLKNNIEIENFPNVLTKDKKKVSINYNFPWGCPPIKMEDGSYQIFCGRGCKNKCFFCQTGWALKYKESPIDIVSKSIILSNRKNKLNYLSNDLSQHSFYKKLPASGHGSYSVKFIKKNGLPLARQIRLGIEGVSERLRNYVNKPIKHEDLIKCTSWLNQNKKGVRWFMIAGLPSETDDDWKELKAAVMEWKKITPKGFLELSFTAFCPDPATPLAIMPINDSYYDNFLEFKSWFFDGIGWSPRIRIHAPQQPKSRLKKAKASMALSEKELYQGGYFGPNDCVDYPYKKAAKKIAEKLKNGSI